MFEKQQEHSLPASQEGKSQSQNLSTKYWEYIPFRCQTPDTKHEKAYLFELFYFCKWLRAASECVLLSTAHVQSIEKIPDSRIQNPEIDSSK